MAQLTYTSSPEEDAGLAYVTAQENARRAAASPPEDPVTEQQYFENIMKGVLASYSQQQRELEVKNASEAFMKADPETQQRIRDALAEILPQPEPQPAPV